MNLFVEHGELIFEINGEEFPEEDLTDVQFMNCIRGIIGLDPLEERGRGGDRNGFELDISTVVNRNPLAEKILSFLKDHPASSRSDIAQGICVECNQDLTNLLLSLRKKKQIHSTGEFRNTRWHFGP